MSKRIYVSTHEAEYFKEHTLSIDNGIPVSGYHKVGDIVISNVQTDNVFGWVCIKEGTPGQWDIICDVRDVNNRILSITDNIEDIMNLLENCEVDIVNIDNRINSLDVKINNVNKELSASINNIGSSNNTKIDEVSSQLNLLKNEVKQNAANEKIVDDNLQNQIDDLKDILGDNTADSMENIAGIRKDLNDLSSQVIQNALKEKAIDDSQQNQIDSLISEVRKNATDEKAVDDAIQEQIEDLKEKDIVLEGQITIIKKGIVDALIENGIDVNMNTSWKDLFNGILDKMPQGIACTGLALNKTELTLEVGDSETLIATKTPNDTTDNLIWLSGNDTVVNINEDGKVTAMSIGTAVITAVCGSQLVTCRVSVIAKEITCQEIFLSNTEITMEIGDVETIYAILEPANTTDPVIWESSDEFIASVNNGSIIAKERGNVIITARCGNKSARCTVVVKNKEIASTSISLNKSSLILEVGDEETLIATVLPQGSTDTITWISHDESIATVDQNGKVTAITIGDAIIEVQCGSNSDTCVINVQAKQVPSTNVILNKTELTLEVGSEETLTATVLPEGCTYDVIWSSSNNGVAKVDQNGKVTAMSVGNVVITATCGLKSANCVVVVEPMQVAATSVSLNKTSLSLEVGQSEVLKATVLPEDCTDPVVWSVNDINIATVTQNGRVDAVAVGNVTITVRCGSKSATCSLVVEPKQVPSTNVILNKTELTLEVGSEETLTATVLPEGCTDPVIWSSNNNNIAKVNSSGKVTAMGIGSVVITVSCGNKMAYCVVTVEAKQIAATSVSLNKTSITLEVGQSEILIATVLPEDCTDPVVWSSQNINIATVTQNGRVDAVGVGSAVIIVRCGNKTSTCEVIVNAAEIPCTKLEFKTDTLTIKRYEVISMYDILTVEPIELMDKLEWTLNGVINVNMIDKTIIGNGIGERIVSVQYGDKQANIFVKTISENTSSCTKVTVNPKEMILRVGENGIISATVTPSNTTDTISWHSTNEAIATVDQNGKVNAKAVGSCAISAVCGNQIDSCVITVKTTDLQPSDVTKLEFKIDSLTLKVGETRNIEDILTVLPSGLYPKVTWKYTSVIDINESNTVLTGREVGNCTLTVYCGDLHDTLPITVVENDAIKPCTSLSLNKTEMTLKVGSSETLTATILPSGCTDPVVWNSQDNNIATVNSSGKVTAMGIGSVVITVSCGNKTAYCVVTVEAEQISATSVSLNKTSLSLEVGQSEVLKATVLPSGCTDPVVWSTSKNTVAVVDQNGRVDAVGVGNVTITVRCGSKSATCSISVTAAKVSCTELYFTQNSVTVNEPDTFNLNSILVIKPTGCTDVVSWSKSGSSISLVDGVVSVLSNGNTTVTATCGSKSASITVNAVKQPVNINCTNVTVNPKEMILRVGENGIISATVTPSNTTDTISWHSTNEAIATVDQNGKVNAKAVGSCAISAVCGNQIDSCVITVKTTDLQPSDVTKLEFKIDSLTLKVGETRNIEDILTVLPSGLYPKVTWKYTSVIEIDEANTVLTGHEVGSCTLTVYCGDLYDTLPITVIANDAVKPCTSLSLNKTELTLKVGQNETLVATVLPSGCTDPVIWSSNSDNIATVNSSGKVTAIAEGRAVITASCGSITKYCVVTVSATQISATSISLNKTTLNLTVGRNETLVATVLPSGCTDPVIWSSSNQNVAIVDQNGRVDAVGAGNAVITVSCGSKYITCNVIATSSTVQLPDTLQFKTEGLTLKVGETRNISDLIVLNPSSLLSKLTWKYTTIISINSSNTILTANEVGTCTLSVWCEGYMFDQIEITVVENNDNSGGDSSNGVRIMKNGTLYNNTEFRNVCKSISPDPYTAGSYMAYELNASRGHAWFSFDGYVDFSKYDRFDITLYTSQSQQKPNIWAGHTTVPGQFGYADTNNTNGVSIFDYSVGVYNKTSATYTLNNTINESGYLVIGINTGDGGLGTVYITDIVAYPRSVGSTEPDEPEIEVGDPIVLFDESTGDKNTTTFGRMRALYQQNKYGINTDSNGKYRVQYELVNGSDDRQCVYFEWYNQIDFSQYAKVDITVKTQNDNQTFDLYAIRSTTDSTDHYYYGYKSFNEIDGIRGDQTVKRVTPGTTGTTYSIFINGLTGGYDASSIGCLGLGLDVSSINNSSGYIYITQIVAYTKKDTVGDGIVLYDSGTINNNTDFGSILISDACLGSSGLKFEHSTLSEYPFYCCFTYANRVNFNNYSRIDISVQTSTTKQKPTISVVRVNDYLGTMSSCYGYFVPYDEQDCSYGPISAGAIDDKISIEHTANKTNTTYRFHVNQLTDDNTTNGQSGWLGIEITSEGQIEGYVYITKIVVYPD